MGYVSELYIRPTRFRLGAVVLRSSAILPTKLKSILVNPVILLPGRAKLATNPCVTGSFTMTNTTGIVEVARFIAAVATEPALTTAAGVQNRAQ